eukprot:Selendium_serpulae@DN4487_c0_g1_i2.p1
MAPKIGAPATPPPTPRVYGIPIKQVALVLLVVQTVSLVILMRYSRTVPTKTRYLGTTCVVVTEVVKIVASLSIVLRDSGWNVVLFGKTLKREIVDAPMETLKVGIISVIYTFQNNMRFIALDNIDAGTYQVVCQLKILTTAFFSVLILGRILSKRKWMSLLILTVGVALTQVPTGGGAVLKPTTGVPAYGFAASAAQCMFSGLSGVLLEYMLKGGTASIWVRNIQLGIYGTVFGMVGVYMTDGAKIIEGGFFQGYNFVVWLIVFNSAIGGLIVAAVLMYADNITKCFGCALAILLSCMSSYFFLGDFTPTIMFLIGGILVLVATYMYSIAPKPKVAERYV